MADIELSLPEAEEVRYPEADWSKRFYNEFDWFRAQPLDIRYAALMQWDKEGKAHQLTGQGNDPYNRSELWYCEPGKFFVAIGFNKGVLNDGMQWFQSASCLKMHGAAVLEKCQALGILPHKTQG